jgi:hypothetical protein
MTIAVPIFLTIAIEAFVRGVVDTGMQFDLEMWKYAREIKRLSANSQIGHEHRPDAHALLMGVDVTTNRNKLRDREIPFERTTGKFRILMLGDSLTFGWGVRVEQTFAKRLESKLNDNGIAAEVINAGVGNYNTSMEVAYYFAEGYCYRPDIVVLNYFINDAEEMPHYQFSWLQRQSAALTFIASRIDIIMRRLHVATRQDWYTYFRNLYDTSESNAGWRGVEDAVQRFAKFNRDRGIEAIVINLPELRQLKPYPFKVEERQVRTLAEQNGLIYLDALPAIADLQPQSLWVSDQDPHPNSVAHDRFAAFIYDFLKSRNLPRTNLQLDDCKSH